MKQQYPNKASRRIFIKNSSIAALGLAAASISSCTESKPIDRKELEKAYATIRQYRHRGIKDHAHLVHLFDELKAENPTEWLLMLEILEISSDPDLSSSIINYLEYLKKIHPELNTLISDGIQILREENPKLHN